ncbi:MAG: hypothetical protein Alpg2KO_08380 [Alphaproteobacteria bacterium]
MAKQHKRGVSLTSYGLIVGLISIVALAAVTGIGKNVNDLFGVVDTQLGDVTGGSAASGAAASPDASPLFSFSSHVFTRCGSTGRFGPNTSDCQTAYSPTPAWDDDAGVFSVVSGIQEWTVPVTGTYRITAVGAVGGVNNTRNPGNGASIQGDFALEQGDTLRILVGQSGRGDASNSCDSGGGGASFVILDEGGLDEADILVIAGGGGGAGQGDDGADATITNAASPGTGNAGGIIAGATGGNGGNTSSMTNHPQSGAGFAGDGQAGSCCGLESTDVARSFANGGAGGRSAQASGNADGGFGGGGGGHGNCSLGSGGGGGYSGGTAGNDVQNDIGGGGGGSFNSGSNPVESTGAGTGAGSVTITLL